MEEIKLHVPDGFIPAWQCAIYYIILIIALYFSGKWVMKRLDYKRIPLMGVLAAGVFAIMTMNVPLPPFGASGHMVGGALVAIIFCGPEAAVIIFTLVLLIQSLLFGDGGITVLGMNVLNMGIIGGGVGFLTFKGLRKRIGEYPAAGVAAWLATVLAALACALEMVAAGIFPLVEGVKWMLFFHIFIGIIESVLTVIVIGAIEKFRPDLLPWNNKKTEGAS